MHAFLFLAALTGARRAQLLGLRWHNVHFDTNRVSFCAGWVEGPDGPVLTTTKPKRSHVVDLDPDSFAVLAEYADTTLFDRAGSVLVAAWSAGCCWDGCLAEWVSG
jgi:integrase